MIAARGQQLVRGFRIGGLVELAAVCLGVAYVVTLLVRFGSILHAEFTNSDVASAPVIAEDFAHAPAGTVVVLGSHAWYATLWFELLTRSFPFHRQLFEIAPFVVALLGVALLVWSSATVAGRWAGAYVAFALLCVGTSILDVMFSGTNHEPAPLCACLLDALLVLLVRSRGRIGNWAMHTILCTVVVAIVAAGAASDSIVFAAGVVPFLVAGLATARSLAAPFARRLAVTVVSVTAATVAGERAAVSAMQARHVYQAYRPITFVAWGQIGTNMRRVAESVASLLNGDFGGAAIAGRGVLAFACGLAATVGAVVAYRAGRDWYRDTRRRTPLRDTAEAGRFAHVGFWASAIVALVLTLVFSSVTPTDRYLVAIPYGIVAIVAVAAGESTRMRPFAVAGAAVVVTGSLVALLARDIKPSSSFDALSRELTVFAQGENLRYGYAAYWDAAALTWASHGSLQVYPVEPCPSPHGLCTFWYHTMSNWYVPRAGRSFLVEDRHYGVNSPGTSLGGIAESITIGEYTVDVYDYDIASNLGPAAHPPAS